MDVLQRQCLSHGSCTLSLPNLCLPALLHIIPLWQLYDQKCLVILLGLLPPLPIQQAMNSCNSANIITNILGTAQLHPSSHVTFSIWDLLSITSFPSLQSPSWSSPSSSTETSNSLFTASLLQSIPQGKTHVGSLMTHRYTEMCLPDPRMNPNLRAYATGLQDFGPVSLHHSAPHTDLSTNHSKQPPGPWQVAFFLTCLCVLAQLPGMSISTKLSI